MWNCHFSAAPPPTSPATAVRPSIICPGSVSYCQLWFQTKWMTCFHILICCFFFFFLAASFQSGKINSPYVFPLVHTFRRGWRIFQRRRRCRQTVTVVGRRSRRWAAKENRDRNRRMWSVGMKTLLFTNAPDRSRRRPCVAAPASQWAEYESARLSPPHALAGVRP